jgi:hypothetical protein
MQPSIEEGTKPRPTRDSAFYRCAARPERVIGPLRNCAGRFTKLYRVLPGFTRHGADVNQLEIRNNYSHHLKRSQEVKMRMTMLAIVATIGAATLAGPARATALMDMPAMSAAYQTAVPAAGCPADSHWVPGHYGRWSEWQPGHCVQD